MGMKETLAFCLAPVEELLRSGASEEEIISASREGMALFMNLYEERKDSYRKFALEHIIVTVDLDIKACYLYLVPELIDVEGAVNRTREVYFHGEPLDDQVWVRVRTQTRDLWERDFFLILADYDDQDRMIGLEFIG